MASTGPINTGDIKLTSVNIAGLKGAFPSGATRTLLAKVLKEFVDATDVDLKSVDVITPDGKKISLLDFVKQLDNTNDLPMAFLLQKAFKNSKVIAEEVLPKVQKYKSDLKWHSGAAPVRITLDLRTAQAKQKDSTNIAAGQGQVNPQSVVDQNGALSKTGKASTTDENSTIVLKFNQDWLLTKVLMKDLDNGKYGKVT